MQNLVAIMVIQHKTLQCFSNRSEVSLYAFSLIVALVSMCEAVGGPYGHIHAFSLKAWMDI